MSPIFASALAMAPIRHDTAQAPRSIFLLERETVHAYRIRKALAGLPWPLQRFASEAELVTALPGAPAGCLVAHVEHPGRDGRRLQTTLRRHRRGWLLIMLTPRTGIESAVAALRTGAYDLFELPVVERMLRDSVLRAMRSLEHQS